MDIRKTCGYVVHFFLPFTLIWTRLDIVFLTFRVFRLSRPGQRSSPSPTSSQSWHGLVPSQARSLIKHANHNANIFIYATYTSPLLHFVLLVLWLKLWASVGSCLLGCDGKDSESWRRYSGSSPAVG